MRETIYTIPVMDAFREDCECAFCQMRHFLEQHALDFILGPSASYMESDIREKTNATGFCRRHYSMLFAMPNRLGVALMAQTHLADVRKAVGQIVKNTSKAKPRKPLFGAGEASSTLSAYTDKLEKNCYVCDMMESTFAKYVDTFFMLWPKEEELRDLVKNGKGFCLPHFALAMDAAAGQLNGAQYESFVTLVTEVQMANLTRMQEDIDWFIQKFDYRFREEPWKNSKDAVRRLIQKLSAEVIDEEKSQS